MVGSRVGCLPILTFYLPPPVAFHTSLRSHTAQADRIPNLIASNASCNERHPIASKLCMSLLINNNIFCRNQFLGATDRLFKMSVKIFKKTKKLVSSEKV